MFASFRDAPSWAQTRNPAPCTALDSGFVHSALLNERPGMTESKTAGRHPEERPLGRVSKDGRGHSWFETAQERLLTMRESALTAGLCGGDIGRKLHVFLERRR